MALVTHYSHPTTPDGPGYDIVLPDAVAVALYSGGSVQPSDALTGMTIAAAVGDVASSGLIFDDPDGTLGHASDGIVGLHRLYQVEDTCVNATDQVVFNGYTGIREYRRGTKAGISPLGAGRRVTCDLQDDNAILAFRKIRTSDGNRPSETADARLLWLLAGILNTVHDTGFIDHTGLAAVTMDAVDYRGQYGRDVLNDIALQTQFNYFCQYNLGGTGSGYVELAFFNDRTSTLLSSTLQVSNDPADNALVYDPVTNPTGVVFRCDEDQSYLRVDSSKTFAGTDVTYQGTGGTSGASASGNSVYIWNSVTAYRYGARDGTAPNSNIKTAAAATLEANKLSNAASVENFLGYLYVTVPNSMLNLIKAGMRLQVKMLHWPAPYNGWNWWRVSRKTFAWALPTDQLYQLQLEITPQILPPCPGSVFTPSGTYYPISTSPSVCTTDSPYGVVAYNHAGGTDPGPPGGSNTPVPGGTNNYWQYWHLKSSPTSPTYGAGAIDFMRGNSANWLNLCFVGNGTATVYLWSSRFGGSDTPPPTYVDVAVAWWTSAGGGTWFYESIATHVSAGDGLTPAAITVPCTHMLDGTDCYQWVNIGSPYDFDSNIGFDHVDWAGDEA